MTKLGKSEAIKTTSPSAASKSRKTQSTQVKKAVPVGCRLLSQYEMELKIREMRTCFQKEKLAGKRMFVSLGGVLTKIWNANQKVGNNELGRAVQPIVLLLDVLEVVFQEGGTVGDGHEAHEGGAEEDGVGEGDDGLLGGVKTQPNRAHHDGETWTVKRKGGLVSSSSQVQGKCRVPLSTEKQFVLLSPLFTKGQT